MAGRGTGPKPPTQSSENPSWLESLSKRSFWPLVSTIGMGLVLYIWNTHVTDFQDFRNDTKGKFEKLEKTIGDNGKALAGIEATLKMLEKLSSGAYRSQATKAGFKETDLQVIPAKLDTGATYEASIPKAKPGYSVKITNLRFSPNTETLSFGLDASIPGLLVKDMIVVEQKVKVGQTVNLTSVLGASFPQIYLRLLDVPTPNQAILAIGSKVEQDSKKPS